MPMPRQDVPLAAMQPCCSTPVGLVTLGCSCRATCLRLCKLVASCITAPMQWVWSLPKLRSLSLKSVTELPDQLTRLTGLTRLDLVSARGRL